MNNVVSSGEVQLQVFKKKLCVFRVFQDSERKTSEHSPNIHGCNSVFFWKSWAEPLNAESQKQESP